MRDPVLVQFHQLLERREKECRVNRRDTQPGGRAIEAGDIPVWPKEQNGIVRRTIGLEAFKDGLGIVEPDGGRFQRKRAIRYDTWVGPAGICNTIHEKHMVGKDLAKTECVVLRFGFGLTAVSDGNVHIHDSDNSLREAGV